MKQAKKFLSFVLIVVMLLSIVPMTEIVIEANALTVSDIQTRMQACKQKYPNGAVWSGTYYANDGTSGPWQCFGFACEIFRELFNCEMPRQYKTNMYELVINNNVIQIGSTLTPGNYNTTQVKNLFSQAKIGDVIQGKSSSSQHTMIVNYADENGISIYDANSDGANGIRTNAYYTWSEFYYYRSQGLSLYRYANYPADAPGKPILSVSDKNTSDKAVTFTWNRTENTSQYDLRIYNYGDYNVAAPYGIWDLNVTTTSGYHKLPAGKYAAYITAISSSGAETPSEWITFDVVDPPEKSVLAATPGEMLTDGVSFTWTKAANAHTYDLRVYNYGDYNVGAPYYNFGMSSSTTSTTIKLPVGKYSAYITCVASNGAETPSEWITFSVTEPLINENYPQNIKSYKMWEGSTATKVFETTLLKEYFLDDNEFTIVEFYANDWVKIKHTLDGEEKTAYVPLAGLITEKSEVKTMYCNTNTSVYTRYTCNVKRNDLPKDKEVLIIGYYKDSLTQICYNENGTYYIGWVSNDNLSIHSTFNHSYTLEVTTEATCTTEGIKTYTCPCGVSYTESINKTAHAEVIDNAVAATCTKTGLTEGRHCSVCSTVIVAQQLVDKTAHKEVIDKVINATCTKTGLTEGKHCSICNTVIVAQQSIDKKAHTEVVDNAVAATCTKTGLTEGRHCSICNTVIVVQETVAIKEHSDNNYDGICDSCDAIITSDSESTNKDNCSCICHKGGFIRIIYKIFRFFWKLFKINPVCSCGAVHY